MNRPANAWNKTHIELISTSTALVDIAKENFEICQRSIIWMWWIYEKKKMSIPRLYFNQSFAECGHRFLVTPNRRKSTSRCYQKVERELTVTARHKRNHANGERPAKRSPPVNHKISRLQKQWKLFPAVCKNYQCARNKRIPFDVELNARVTWVNVQCSCHKIIHFRRTSFAEGDPSHLPNQSRKWVMGTFLFIWSDDTAHSLIPFLPYFLTQPPRRNKGNHDKSRKNCH